MNQNTVPGLLVAANSRIRLGFCLELVENKQFTTREYRFCIAVAQKHGFTERLINPVAVSEFSAVGVHCG